MKIGANIKRLRVRAELSQEALARKIEVTPSAVCNYEKDLSFPKPEILYRMFYALRTSPNEVFGYSPMESSEVREHTEKYKKLDEQGRQAVDESTERELERMNGESVRLAARNGGQGGSELHVSGDLLDAPDYRGGRK